eukprot:CAMPEP_0115768094 /NCGR_PEP_ID=MMETSP0272-20121206/104010_1 /TAXON_ID=71861 /ORGANISM="Scrippsiella trochoidea, Strain CCMP3099" /LENGTH=58 /DNA_ID=CAMNT_0003214125 /DNA_START=83 /DNA_END=256 /DNA_ORIENTATION=-
MYSGSMGTFCAQYRFWPDLPHRSATEHLATLTSRGSIQWTLARGWNLEGEEQLALELK